ncbi:MULTISPECIES: hypothetical protein [Pseudomonas]|uniref:Uncharacterized protein n=1 Tax=Pseudomonas fluorescens TaxID=294 RepID=A0A5E6VP78_PSEFL|nr:hypothetical protein PS652_04213 [Pseudomonas fluorescens]
MAIIVVPVAAVAIAAYSMIAGCLTCMITSKAIPLAALAAPASAVSATITSTMATVFRVG